MRSILVIIILSILIISGCIGTIGSHQMVTEEELQVINIQSGEYFITGGDYYKVTYVNKTSLIINKVTLDYKRDYKVYKSNESNKLIIGYNELQLPIYYKLYLRTDP